jgi:hypothetical protein
VHHDLVLLLHYALQVARVQEVPDRVSLFVIDPELEQVPVETSFGSFMPTKAVAQFLVC